MYKFEISANSPQELKLKMRDFAQDLLKEDFIPSQPELPKYVDEGAIIHDSLPWEKESAVQPTTPLATNGELDTHGMPYDSRIHSTTKSKNKDGSWRYQRGIDDSKIAAVESENIQASTSKLIVNPIPPAPAPTVQVEMPTFPNTTPQAPSTDPNFFAPLTAVVNPAATPSQPVQSKYEDVPIPNTTRPVHSLATFKQNLMMVIASLITEGKLTHEYIEELKKYFQVKEIWNILGSEAQCLELFNTFVEHGFLTKVE